jgi:hypothetical protein
MSKAIKNGDLLKRNILKREKAFQMREGVLNREIISFWGFYICSDVET